MTDFAAVDFFSDESCAADPYPYFDFLRSGGRYSGAPHGVLMVTGHEEALAVYRTRPASRRATR